jgi:hypothetical protein
MKKLILSIGVIALTFGSIMSAKAICRNRDGSILVVGGWTYSGQNSDGTCSGCNWDCGRPLPQP